MIERAQEAQPRAGVVEAIGDVLAASGDADDALRAVVTTLVERGGCSWAGILFSERGELVLGPEAGEPDPGLRVQLPVVHNGDHVAELVVDGWNEPATLERVAELISAHCLVGWDTGGQPWTP